MQKSDTPDAPEFWFSMLMKRFSADLPDDPYPVTNPNAPTTRRERLDFLWSYYQGRMPPPSVSEQYRATFENITRKARVNYPELAVGAMTDRSILTSVYTDQDKDLDGDDVALSICEASQFESMHRDLQTYLFAMGEAYAMVIPPELSAFDEKNSTDTEQPELEVEGVSGPVPIITAEDPRNCIGYEDPLRPGKLRAAVKVFYDDVLDRQCAILFWNNQAFKVLRDEGADSDSFSEDEWEFDGNPVDTSAAAEFGGIPVVKFTNKDGMGEFEKNIDVIDRIMDGIMHRVVISWYQSFRQRAIRGDMDEAEDLTEDDSFASMVRTAGNDGGESIKDMFQADPGALWFVPKDVDFWESEQADMAGALRSVHEDVVEFAAATRTPMHLITPEAEAQTAAGASIAREGLVDKIVDRQARMTPSWRLLFQIALCLAGQEERAKSVELQWAKVERSSLEAQADACGKLTGGSAVVSRRYAAINILGMSPKEARRNEEDLLAEGMSTEGFIDFGQNSSGASSEVQTQGENQITIPDNSAQAQPTSSPEAVGP